MNVLQMLMQPEGITPEIQINCPICNFNFVQFEEPELIYGKNDYATGKNVRGDVIKIPMKCENAHAWNLYFGFHKGETLVWVEESNYHFLYKCPHGLDFDDCPDCRH